MTDTTRTETTARLSALVEKRPTSRASYWAREVGFDRGTPMWRRIDHMGFKPHTPNYAVEPVSVELGTFSCYEVKSCLADFESGNGLTLYGDLNHLVTTREPAEQLHDMRRMPRNINQVLARRKATGPHRSTTRPTTEAPATGIARQARCRTPWSRRAASGRADTARPTEERTKTHGRP